MKSIPFPRKYRFLPLILIPLLALTMGICLAKSPSRQFHKVNEALFYQEMCSSTLNLHYTLANPGDFGIQDYVPRLPIYDADSRQESIPELEKTLEVYKNLNPSRLSPRNNQLRKLLINYLESSLALAQYPYHQDPFSPSSGIHSQLPILLAEYTFRSTRDVEDYLALLSQTGEYFSSLLKFEAEKKAAGLLTAASSLRRSAAHCRSIITKDSLESCEHFLQITFENRLNHLASQVPLTDEEIRDYLTRNQQLLEDIVLPAYQQLAKGLESLADPTIELEGLAAKPDGAAYYELLLASQTGSSRDIASIAGLLADHLSREYDALKALLVDTDAKYLEDEFLSTYTQCFPLQNCSSMLADLGKRMTDLFPALPDAADATPSVHIKEVDPCLQEYCAPAFYLTPPIDDTLQNTIYINTKKSVSSLELYTTLAHEGFPGHLYQTVYSNQLQLAQDNIPVQQILWYGGYLEGWALYVEFMAYDYATQIMEDSGYPEYANLIQIEKHNRSTQLCLYSLLDIYIHHENADLKQTAELLARFGITNSASVSNIYQYIAEEPANYPKYYLGYLEILDLKEGCRKHWKEQYSDLTFHQFFLENGPADFATLQELAASWSPATPPSYGQDTPDPTKGSSISSLLPQPAW